MDSKLFSQRYIEILEDVVGRSTRNGLTQSWLASELEDKLKDLFKNRVTQKEECGQGYHFGLIRNEMELLSLSSICLNSILMQDIIYRYSLVINNYSKTSKRKYLIWGNQDRDKLLKKASTQNSRDIGSVLIILCSL